MKEKKESSFSRLMGFAENYKSFTYISLVLSAVSSVLALFPFYYIWKIIKEVLDVMPNFQNATGIVKNGVFAVIFALLSMLIYIAALLCSHTSAFRGTGKYAQTNDAQDSDFAPWRNRKNRQR